MSSFKAPKEFVADFALYEADLLEDGVAVEEIKAEKQRIRDNWHDEDFRNDCITHVKACADIVRERIALARGITERVKSRLKEAA